MSKQFRFEKNLPHQTRAVNSIIEVFKGLPIRESFGIDAHLVNPIIDKDADIYRYRRNIQRVQEVNSIAFNPPIKDSNIIDIMMETGTGKTYTYVKAMFEINKHYGIFKFIVVVPTLAIKAGTVNFLKSESAREHFKEQYGKVAKVYVVESQKGGKKEFMPTSILDFVRVDRRDKDSIHVLVINAGMINSDTLKKNFDRTLFDKYSRSIDALACTNPFVIIDEPHRFAKENKTWENIQLLKPQYILRFGATFKEFENLIYTLTAVDAFNQGLVKGVIAHIEDFGEGKNVYVRFVNSDGREVTFELVEDGKRVRSYKLAKGESLEKIHPEMEGLFIDKINKREVLLSNGLTLKKGDKINPYSYSETLQERMIRKAIRKHFELERELLTQRPRIKPLTLFFIDNIEEHRREDGYIRKVMEETVEAVAKEYLKKEKDEFYREFLKKTLEDVRKTHAGYYAEDKGAKDEEIEEEINEILHDKEKLLDINNPRRFIFSKWTLREGWDNPNIFQICKLRSSGSEISKLQEVGRGLRLPVNEHMARVKDRQFFLHYYVDFSESDFVDKLVKEINEKSNALHFEVQPPKLTDEMIRRILEIYSDRFKDENELLETLDDEGVIRRDNSFKEGGFEYIKQNFPLIFDGVSRDKIRKASEKSKKVKVRVGKYPELKELWEELNRKAILEYKIKSEKEFRKLFKGFLLSIKEKFHLNVFHEKRVQVEIEDNQAISRESELLEDGEILPIVTMSYKEFVVELAKAIGANVTTLHQIFKEVKEEFDINNYLNLSTIRTLKQEFNNYLFFNAITKFGIAYKEVRHSVHPTKLTDKDGEPLEEVDSSSIGLMYSEEKVADSYYFEELFYDSELERENIRTDVEKVIVFTKIPKNSIKIPLAGGKSYSPDFAYVIESKDGKKKLYFVVETKNVNIPEELRISEYQKLKYAKKFFEDKVMFEIQFSKQKIRELIEKVYNG